MQRRHCLGPRPPLHEDLASAVAHDGMVRHGRRQVAVDRAQRVFEAALGLGLERLADRRLQQPSGKGDTWSGARAGGSCAAAWHQSPHLDDGHDAL